jgi:hypothetical protein
MPAYGNQLLRHALCLLAILAPIAPAAFGQADTSATRPAPLLSRPAAVALVATLESLSVTTSPAGPPLSAWPADSAAMAVTTGWTIRANCTTLRVSGYSGGFSVFGRDSLSVSPGDNSDGFPPRSGPPTSSPYEADWAGIAQPVGPTSYPGSRTDNIHVAIDRRGKSGSDAPLSTIYILAQAL